MDTIALWVRSGGKKEKITIEQALLLPKTEIFVNPEKEYRVCPVQNSERREHTRTLKSGKTVHVSGSTVSAYFKPYYSLEAYRKLFPEKAGDYASMVQYQRHIMDSPWHTHWVDVFSEWCKTNEYIKNEETGRYKYADAYDEENNVVYEVQHSFMKGDFEQRNKFYKEIGKKIVWLVDATINGAYTKYYDALELYEDNWFTPFFRIIIDNDFSFEEIPFYIQLKDGSIYRITGARHLKGNEAASVWKAKYNEEYKTEEDFIKAIKGRTDFSYPKETDKSAQMDAITLDDGIHEEKILVTSCGVKDSKPYIWYLVWSNSRWNEKQKYNGEYGEFFSYITKEACGMIAEMMEKKGVAVLIWNGKGYIPDNKEKTAAAGTRDEGVTLDDVYAKKILITSCGKKENKPYIWYLAWSDKYNRWVKKKRNDGKSTDFFAYIKENSYNYIKSKYETGEAVILTKSLSAVGSGTGSGFFIERYVIQEE